MDPSGKEVFRYVSLEMPNIIEASITKARLLGNSQVTPLHVIDKIIIFHYSLFCKACLRCKDLELRINDAISQIPITSPAQPPLTDAISQIPITFPAEPPLTNAVVVSIRIAINTLSGGWFSDMEDVDKLFLLLLDEPTVRNVMEQAGFSISVIKHKLENRGSTVFICRL